MMWLGVGETGRYVHAMNSSIELISIGNELLSGRTLNTHAQTLGSALSAIGLTLSRDTTIADDIEIIQSVVKDAMTRTDIIVVSGGLGPTVDDITRTALAKLFDRDIVLSPAALESLHQRFKEQGRAVTPVSERMAFILEGAEPLINSAGAAAAQRLDFPDTGKTIFILPGPPAEFTAVLTDHMIPWLCKAFPNAAPLELRILNTLGIGESDIVTRLETAGFECPDVSIGFYPGAGRVEIRLAAPKEKIVMLNDIENVLRELLHDHLTD